MPMRKALAPLALLVLVLPGVGRPADKKNDKELLQGSWAVTGVEFDGMELPDGEARQAFKSTVLTFQGDNLNNSQARDTKGTFILDASKSPRTLDLIAEKDGTARRMYWVYELDGDTLRICFGPRSGDERPKEVTSRDKHILLTLKREKKSDR
jgi:uncharacterized protein (TIGR03067 family)